jgi:hypothetical protein
MLIILEMLNEEEKFALEVQRRELSGVCARDQSMKKMLYDEEHQRLLEYRYEARAERVWRQQQNIDLETEINKEKMKKEIGTEKFKTLVGPDPYEREMMVMAMIKAHYHLSATRFVEMVWLGLHADLKRLSENSNLFDDMIAEAHRSKILPVQA